MAKKGRPPGSRRIGIEEMRAFQPVFPPMMDWRYAFVKMANAFVRILEQSLLGTN